MRGLTQINIEVTMYPIQTSSLAEDATGVIVWRGSVVFPNGSLLEFRPTQALTVKQWRR